MFAIVRTGGKQYRVAAGDKIVVEKLSGEAGDSISLGDVLLAGDGGDLKPTAGLTVSAEIIAQAKGEKVIVFKKRRRHNYRRRNGHRQQLTILKILAIGEEKKAAPKKADAAPIETKAPEATQIETKAEATPVETKAQAAPKAPTKAAAPKTETTAAAKPAAKKAPAKKPAADKE